MVAQVSSPEVQENGTSSNNWSTRTLRNLFGESKGLKNVPLVRFGEWIPDRRDGNCNLLLRISS